MNLVIDIGNTVAKLAVFDGDEVVEVLRGSNHSLDWLSMLCHKYHIERGIIASVITLSNTIRRQLKSVNFDIMELDYRTPVPIRNFYKTPQTLGMDRLAAVVGANYLCPGKTCWSLMPVLHLLMSLSTRKDNTGEAISLPAFTLALKR